MRHRANKTCHLCQREFSKVEHLERHLRRHSGEKRFKCHHCGKRYVRSDVLRRHIRDHHGERNEVVNGINMMAMHRNSESEIDLSLGQVDSHSHSRHINGDVQTTSSHESRMVNVDAIHELPQNYCDDSAVLDCFGFDDFFGSTQTATLPAQANSLMGAFVYPYNASLSEQVGTSQVDQPATIRLPHGTGLTFGDPFTVMPYDGLACVDTAFSGVESSDQIEWTSQAIDSIPPTSNDSYSTLLLHPDQVIRVEAVNSEEHSTTTEGTKSVPSGQIQSQQATLTSGVSQFTFTRHFASVEYLWPFKTNIRHQNISRSLWGLVIDHCEANIFSNKQSGICESWQERRNFEFSHQNAFGFNDECYLRIIRDFYPLRNLNESIELEDRQPQGTNPRVDSQRLSEQNSSATLNKALFPSSEILAASLDLYFSQFHHLMPFIHRATFQATKMDTSVLFAMCLVGLTFIADEGAKNCVGTLLTAAIRASRKRLTSNTYREHMSVEVLASLASAMLLLCVSRMVPENLYKDSARMMYFEAISLSQRHNVFPTDDGNNIFRTLRDGTSDQEKWEAWARMESTKRLCVCLLMGDAMFSYEYEVKPILHFEPAKYIVPADFAAFDSPNPVAWREALRRPHTEMVRLQTATLPQSIGNYEMHGLLAICWAQVSEGHHRLLDTDSKPSGSINPARVLAQDPQTRGIAAVLSGVYHIFRDTFAALNPNCLVCWHNICMNLTVDRLLFQDAAGKNGTVRAKAALEVITQWSGTTTARRSCLHAAQTFRIMCQRKISDGMMFQSENALFESALVLGFYLYVRPPVQWDNGPCEEIEIVDEVDWTSIGTLGLSQFEDEGHVSDTATPNSKSRRFILDGLPICFEGVPCPGGFRSAQRIFLAFSALLSHVAPWNARRYSSILQNLGVCNF